MSHSAKYILVLLSLAGWLFSAQSQNALLGSGNQTGGGSRASLGSSLGSFSGSGLPGDSDSDSGLSGSASSKKKEVALRVRSWTIDKTLGERRETPLDTLSLNFQNLAVPERNATVAASYLANIGSPFLSMVYADRQAEEKFIFMQPYDQWKTSNEEMCYINTTRPYTNGTYVTTIGNDQSQEENFKFSFTANFNKRLNIGADYESVNSRGFYTNLAARDVLAHFFANYLGERYQAHGRYSINRFENKENGGITNDDYITKPLEMSGGYREYESLNIPVALSNTYNLTTFNELFFNHKYHLGFYKEEINEAGDTLEVFVPVSSFIHTLEGNIGHKFYDSNTANASYYNRVANISDKLTADSVSLITLRNTLGLSLNEGFHRWMKFGLTAYAEHEYRRYGSNTGSLGYPHSENLLWVGGRLSSTQDSILQFRADAKLSLLGDYIGNFDVNGSLNSSFRLWKQTVDIAAEAFVRNEKPDYFYRHFYSNHYAWNQDLQNIYRVRMQGVLSIPGWGSSLKGGVENISNYVYFDGNAQASQYDGQIQVLYAQWKQQLSAGIFHFDFDVVGQMSSRPQVLPLPALAAYGNVYLRTRLSKVMLTHIGVDCRYFSSYYVPAYNPALGQYYLQTEKKIGNYPYMNVYANMHLKQARFFVMYTHGSRLFADPNYFTVLHYPQNPAQIKAGISWNFYD